MNTPLISALMYFLGFVGLASIGLLPARSWKAVNYLIKNNPITASRFILNAVTALIVVCALFFDVQISIRIFRCLTSTYCGPSIASGWTYLAMLGVAYLAFEAIVFAISKIGRASRMKPATQ